MNHFNKGDFNEHFENYKQIKSTFEKVMYYALFTKWLENDRIFGVNSDIDDKLATEFTDIFKKELHK